LPLLLSSTDDDTLCDLLGQVFSFTFYVDGSSPPESILVTAALSSNNPELFFAETGIGSDSSPVSKIALARVLEINEKFSSLIVCRD
jgi:hypothetical protein